MAHHLRIVPTPGDRRFVVVFLAALALAIFAVVALSVIVDPTVAFRTGLVPPLTPNDRDAKAGLYATHPPVQVLILGSSRVMKFNPACIERVAGQSAFNFGVSSARAEDYLAILRFASAHGPLPARILLGVDIEAFHEDDRIDDRLMQSAVLGPLASSFQPAPAVRWLRSAVASLSMTSVRADVDAVLRARGRGRPGSAFSGDGFLSYDEWERAVAAGTFAQQPLVAASVSAYRDRFEGFTKLSRARLSAFREFLDIAKRGGAQVDAFLLPLHPELEQAMKQSVMAARTADVRAELTADASRGLLRFTDLSALEAFGGDARFFFDGVHMMEANAARIIARLYGAPAGTCAVQ